MITEGKPYFLSRPRRFGKSLLISTLAAVFEGRRDLFEAFTTEQGIDTTADNRDRSALMSAYRTFRLTDDLPAFIEAVKIFYASVPYHWAHDNRNEHYYHELLYTLLTAFGADIRVEEPTAKGRADLTLPMPRGICVMELKYEREGEHGSEADTVQAALDQISLTDLASGIQLIANLGGFEGGLDQALMSARNSGIIPVTYNGKKDLEDEAMPSVV